MVDRRSCKFLMSEAGRLLLQAFAALRAVAEARAAGTFSLLGESDNLRGSPSLLQGHRDIDIYVVGFVCKLFSKESTKRFTYTDATTMFQAPDLSIVPRLKFHMAQLSCPACSAESQSVVFSQSH